MKRTILLLCIISICSCDKPGYLFELTEGSDHGISFENTLSQTPEMNILDYMYFYNGGGVAAGDFNNDGRIDLFFTGNQVSNTLYLNKGNLKFEDVTERSLGKQSESWSTGVSIVDINNDGFLDIYVCEVGDFRSLQGKNKLYVCQGVENGIPNYEEEAAEYGLDFSGFSTQAAFLDYDLDGDLDVFLLNHSVHNNNSFAPRDRFADNYDPTAGDQFFRNEGGVYVNVTEDAGIHSNEIGYGLGIAVSDINFDGYPDLYIGNDFHENDYLYINQRDGTFKETLSLSMGHTSRFSMGVDIADINNDGFQDIVSLDMLPYDPKILRRSEGEDPLNTFNYKLKYGYNHQYARNAVQLNNKNGTFSEIAMQLGVHATDWSWAPLIADFDLDSKNDLFISNGIPKRMNDIDYINFISNHEIQKKADFGKLDSKDMDLLAAIPEIKLPNRLFIQDNTGSLKTANTKIKNDQPSYSNGAIYADLDNDGDLDVVTNNINSPVFIYENLHPTGHSTSITLRGPEMNGNALGAKIIVHKNGGPKSIKEYQAVRGFLSASMSPIVISSPEISKLEIIWPDNTFSIVEDILPQMTISYEKGLDSFSYEQYFSSDLDFTFVDYTDSFNIDLKHKENPFNEFDREPLIPWTTATEGPALAVGDLDGNGLMDIFMGSSKREQAHLLLQRTDGQFENFTSDLLQRDSTYEEVDALIEDLDSDGREELLMLSGGNEYAIKSRYNQARIFDFNDDSIHLIDSVFLTGQKVVSRDYDEDGDLDLFLGARAVPKYYGQIPTSYLLKNDGNGVFTFPRLTNYEELSRGGMVKDALWTDDNELIVAYEWGKIIKYTITDETLESKEIYGKNGFWSKLISNDFDNDGDLDLIALNMGNNHRWRYMDLKMYVDDFDQNGTSEQVVTYTYEGKEIPFANFMELQTQIPVIKKKFLKAADFSEAEARDILDLKNAKIFTATEMESLYLENQGNGNYKSHPLPFAVQRFLFKDGIAEDFNKDGKMDLFLGGNFYGNTMQLGRSDGNYGCILMNDGDGTFSYFHLPGLTIDGEIRKIKRILIGQREYFVVARNNEKLKIIGYE